MDNRFTHTLYNLSDVNRYKLERLKEINASFEAESGALEKYWEKNGK